MKTLILFLLLVPILTVNANAFEFKVNAAPNFMWSVQAFFEDVHEAVEFDSTKKAQLEASHAENAQKEIERLTTLSEPIPVELMDRVDQKLENAEQSQQQAVLDSQKSGDTILDKITDATEKTISVVRQVSEVNEIRQLVGEYTVLGDRVKNNEITESDARQIAMQLDQRTNSLETFKANCWKPISSYDLAIKENPYQELQEICPELKKYNIDEARRLLDSLP